jgi:glucokinase
VQQQTFLGIEIGGTKLQVVCGYADGTVLATHRYAVEPYAGATGIRNNIAAAVQQYAPGEIAAVGVGFGGPVNRNTGTVETSFHVEGWSGFPLGEWLALIAEAPVLVENDANVAALGEAAFGAGRGHRSVLYVTLGSGVGGGLVVDGQLYHGEVPGELEIGHIQMDRNGSTLQDVCSGWAVDAKIRAAVAAHPESTLARLVGQNRSSEALFLRAALDAGDPVAQALWEETTDDLAFGLSHAVHLLHPGVLVLGGGLSFMGDALEEPVRRKLPRYLMKAFAPGPEIKLSGLKEKAVPAGALVLSSQHL